jgi:hypothetical protein
MIFVGLFDSGIGSQLVGAGSEESPSSFVLSLLSLLIVLLGLVMAGAAISVIMRQRALLAEGDLIMGRVTERAMAYRSAFQNIRYEFTTPSGERRMGISSDLSVSLGEGMSVPVFRDPHNPKRQLALCASYFDVVIPRENFSTE